MFMLTRRLQILLDEDRYERIERESRRTNQSVAATIRDAIDRAYPSDADAKRRAADAILAAEPMDLPATVEELKREIAEAHSRSL
jgi:septum formation topological specificity factor MinE